MIVALRWIRNTRRRIKLVRRILDKRPSDACDLPAMVRIACALT